MKKGVNAIQERDNTSLFFILIKLPYRAVSLHRTIQRYSTIQLPCRHLTHPYQFSGNGISFTFNGLKFLI